MSSAISKTFCRVLLQRAKKTVKSIGACQLAGPHKQTCDYVFCAHRLMQLEREWRAGLCFLKIDLEKAFDNVSRPALSAYLEQRIGRSHELRVWQSLMSRSSAVLETCWGSSELEIQKGIRQGSVESPLFFACLAELTLETAAVECKWPRCDPGLPDLPLSEMMFVDDSILWNSSLRELGQRVEDWARYLARAGLKINLGKCELYVSPYYVGERKLVVGGQTLLARESLTVMGIPMHVHATTCELLAGLLGRARDAFWSMKKLMCSQSPLHARIKLMEKVVAGTGLWYISAFFPEHSALHLVNTFQLQLVISMMGLKRGAQEGWLLHRKKAYRAARGALWKGGHRRWSTIWCERHWGYLGHLSRGMLHIPTTAATTLSAFRNIEWWNQEKQKKEGVRVKQHASILCTVDECGKTP